MTSLDQSTLEWLTPEAMLPTSDVRLLVYACRPRRYRRRWIALLQRHDETIVYGQPATTIDAAIDKLRAEYLRRIRRGWRP